MSMETYCNGCYAGNRLINHVARSGRTNSFVRRTKVRTVFLASIRIDA